MLVKHRSLIGKLLLVVLGMFVFAYAMVPLYDTICRVAGLNGRTGGRVRVSQSQVVDLSRTIRVEFVTHNNQEMPWEFYGQQHFVDVHPGEVTKVMFYA